MSARKHMHQTLHDVDGKFENDVTGMMPSWLVPCLAVWREKLGVEARLLACMIAAESGFVVAGSEFENLVIGKGTCMKRQSYLLTTYLYSGALPNLGINNFTSL